MMFKVESGMKFLFYLSKKDFVSGSDLKALFGDLSRDLYNLEQNRYLISITEDSEKKYSLSCYGEEVVREWILKMNGKEFGKMLKTH